jgi:cyclopropane fatty-acyl-phospholipid synthase-like methyltransferase
MVEWLTKRRTVCAINDVQKRELRTMADRLGSEPKTEYVLGHSQREIRRLMLQAAILRLVTERLLRGAGMSQGMRVLEMGCGAGRVV